MSRLKSMLSFLVLLLAPLPAHAVHTLTLCGETCGSGEQCVMDRPLTCPSSPGVYLNAGADLDFKGFTITCSGCPANTSVGVIVNNSNSTVEDSVGGGGVAGPWGIGINCQYNTNSQVNNVRVSNATSVGLRGCRKVRGAVVTNAGWSADGIVNWQIGSSDYVKESYITGGGNGIWLEGSGAASIDHNSIAGNSGFSILAIYTSASLQVTGNSLFSNGSNYPILAGNTPPTVSGNVCGDPTDAACADCIGQHLCSAANTPFVGP